MTGEGGSQRALRALAQLGRGAGQAQRPGAGALLLGDDAPVRLMQLFAQYGRKPGQRKDAF